MLASATAFGVPPGAARSQAPQQYGYIFNDDPMRAGGFGPSDPRIVIVPHGLRFILIRPRTSFIIELFKSIEKI